jgi:hypothetical protein
MVGIVRGEASCCPVEDQHTILDEVGKVFIDSTLIQGNQEFYFVIDGMDWFVFYPYLVEIVPASDSRFDVLVYEDEIAMTDENLSHDEADGLHALARLAPNTDTHIHAHKASLPFIVRKKSPEMWGSNDSRDGAIHAHSNSSDSYFEGRGII